MHLYASKSAFYYVPSTLLLFQFIYKTTPASHSSNTTTAAANFQN